MNKIILCLIVSGLSYQYASSQTTANNGVLTTPLNTNLMLRTNSSTTNRLTILNSGSGYIGINTDAPQGRLDINEVGGQLRLSGGTLAGGVWTGSGPNTLLWMGNWGDVWKGIQINLSNGFVGMGTSPGHPLHIKPASASAYINLDKPGDTYESGLMFTKAGATQFFLYNDDTNNSLKIQAAGLAGEGDLSPRMQFPVGNKNIYMAESGGNVGIGTANPETRLHVAGGLMTLDGSLPAIYTGTGSGDLGRYLQVLNSWTNQSASGLKAGGILVSDSYTYANPSKNDLIVKGKVAIGTPTTNSSNDYKLSVNGRIGAKDVQIESTSNAWPDYVFSEGYQLPDLYEVEQYINKNRHLADIPSAEEVKAKGYSVNDMDEQLLKKIEELTLYIIQQQKQIDALQTQLDKIN